LETLSHPLGEKLVLPGIFVKGEYYAMHRDTQPQQVPKQLKLTAKVFEHMKDTIGTMRAEQGGILGGNRKTGEVTFFFFDDTGSQSGVSYTPNISLLNTVIKKHWKPNGIEYMGSIHTHPPFITHLSPGDETYAKRILDAMVDLPYLLAPIALSIPDTGSFSLFPYAVERDGNGIRIIEQELVVGGEAVTFERGSTSIPEFIYEFFRSRAGRALLAAIGFTAVGIASLAGSAIYAARAVRSQRAEK
jgi:hypothetical protein